MNRWNNDCDILGTIRWVSWNRDGPVNPMANGVHNKAKIPMDPNDWLVGFLPILKTQGHGVRQIGRYIF